MRADWAGTASAVFLLCFRIPPIFPLKEGTTSVIRLLAMRWHNFGMPIRWKCRRSPRSMLHSHIRMLHTYSWRNSSVNYLISFNNVDPTHLQLYLDLAWDIFIPILSFPKTLNPYLNSYLKLNAPVTPSSHNIILHSAQSREQTPPNFNNLPSSYAFDSITVYRRECVTNGNICERLHKQLRVIRRNVTQKLWSARITDGHKPIRWDFSNLSRNTLKVIHGDRYYYFSTTS
jgi:hypothetical protein